MKKKVILCTKNKGKVKEFEELFNFYNIDIELISLYDLDDFDEVEENGTSFKENAFIKANYYFQKYHLPTISDDSGLCIAALNGEPGINSARFSGLGPKENIKKVLRLLENKTNREAYFMCVICYIDEAGNPNYFEGRVNGFIDTKETGDNGFGYDPIFLVDYKGKLSSFATLGEDIKNKMSHRANAFSNFTAYWQAKK